MNTNNTEEASDTATALMEATNSEIDPETDVIIKSEWHFLTDDLREELTLIRTNAFDSVIFESARENVEEIPSPSMLKRLMSFPIFLLSPLYVENGPLIVEAVKRKSDLRFTRESDGDVIGDLPTIAQVVILTVVVAFGLGIAWFAALSTVNIDYAFLSLVSYLLLFATPLAIRFARGKVSGDLNRNKIMANCIEDAIESNADLVLVPLGKKHVKPVRDVLEDEIRVQTIPPTHGFLSAKSMREFIPGFLGFLVLFVAVWIVAAAVGGGAMLVLYDILPLI